MAAITIRNLDDRVKQRLRERAAERGNSMEEEARSILRLVLLEADPDGILYSERHPGPRRFVPKEEITPPMGGRIDYKQFREDIDRHVDQSIEPRY